MSEKAKAQLTAEVQFLEAFAYHNLWKYMGGVLSWIILCS